MPNGIQALLEILHASGVRTIFGNPGTTEMPLNDALVTDSRFQYVLGLQEVPVMAMADGYAMASGKLGVVNLHICCGLGNAMGMLYNAFREGTPLLVTAGQQDRRLAFEEPILAGDMVSVARPWTKWAAEVHRVADIPSAVRRAIQTALMPPTGPVFLSLPVDVQMDGAEGLGLSPPNIPSALVRPPTAACHQAAETLLGAKNPAILAGSRITERDAMPELVKLAELLGAPVITESGTTHGRLAFPAQHPLNGQGLPLWSPEIRDRLAEYDVVLVVGMDLLRQYIYHDSAPAIPAHIRLVHIDEDPWQIGKNYPVAVGVLGHAKIALGELAEYIANHATAAQRQAFAERSQRTAAIHAAERARLEARIAGERLARPITSLTIMDAIARALPDDAAVIEEAVTTTNTTLERKGALRNTTGYFGHRGWSLGWGLGVTLGAKLAWPQRPVLGILGEGAALYGIQGLWTAARYKIPAVFVVCNNAAYQILKVCAQGLGLPQAAAGKFAGVDLVEPEVDVVGLARAFGVEARRISEPDELTSALQEAFASDRPSLFDVPIARGGKRLEYGS